MQGTVKSEKSAKLFKHWALQNETGNISGKKKWPSEHNLGSEYIVKM